MCALRCTEARICNLLFVCVCVCMCVPPPPPPMLIWLPPTCRSAGVWLIWAELVVTSWTGVDFLSSPNTDLVFIIGSVSCLYVFIDQCCYGRRYRSVEEVGPGLRGGRGLGGWNQRVWSLSVFPAFRHKSLCRRSGCSYSGKVLINRLRTKSFASGQQIYTRCCHRQWSCSMSVFFFSALHTKILQDYTNVSEKEERHRPL